MYSPIDKSCKNGVAQVLFSHSSCTSRISSGEATIEWSTGLAIHYYSSKLARKDKADKNYNKSSCERVLGSDDKDFLEEQVQLGGSA